MTRYDTPNSDTSHELQGNLTPVRSGLTTKPQNTLADLRLRPTPYGLELHMNQKRIRDRLIFKPKKEAPEAASGLSIRSAIATVTLVGGAVAITSSAIFGALIAAILPILYKAVKHKPREIDAQAATLRFVNAPNGRTLLSMTTALEPQRSYPYSKRPLAEQIEAKRDVHFSNLPVRLISASTYVFGGQLSVMLYERDHNGRNKLRITGSQQEIRWLHDKISSWNNQQSA